MNDAVRVTTAATQEELAAVVAVLLRGATGPEPGGGSWRDVRLAAVRRRPRDIAG